MVAVVTGERRAAKSRPKAAPASRGAPARGRPVTPRDLASRSNGGSGLGPRLALTIGALVILGGGVAGLLLNRHEPAAEAPASPVARLLASVGFRLDRVEVEGAPAMATAAILRETGLHRGQPILGVSLDALHQRIDKAGWVKDATIMRLLPDTLIIHVTPRQPLAVWQHLGATHVVDTEGVVIGDADPGRFTDLPLVVGEGAAEQAHLLLPVLRQHAKVMGALDALVRVDDRRWDLRLKDGTIIELPAVGEDSALLRLDQLDRDEHILSLGLERIDLRQPDQVAVRPRAPDPATAAASQKPSQKH